MHCGDMTRFTKSKLCSVQLRPHPNWESMSFYQSSFIGKVYKFINQKIIMITLAGVNAGGAIITFYFFVPNDLKMWFGLFKGEKYTFPESTRKLV